MATDTQTQSNPTGASPQGRPQPASHIVNAFTVDVEDYFQVNAFADRISPNQWDQYESRVVNNTHRMLRILERHEVRATFFILGWVADRFPGLVRDIQKAGHEIGCHSFWHRIIYNMTPDEFREDLIQATKAIEEVTGERVVAFRAPSFSITSLSLWALEILVEEGYRYDSSIFPVHHDFYGIPNAERSPHVIETKQGSLCEFPPSVVRKWRYNVPVAGGGYFRLYPRRLSIRWLGEINRKHGRPFMFYIHPWEIDPDQPRLAAGLRSRFRQYQNLKRTESKLHSLLGSHEFGTLSEAVNGQDNSVGRLVPISTLQTDAASSHSFLLYRPDSRRFGLELMKKVETSTPVSRNQLRRNRHWSSQAAEYDSNFESAEAILYKQLEAELLIELTGAQPGRKILDVCSGTGRTALALARTGADVCAVDSAEGMVRQSREKAANLQLTNVSFLLGDVMSLPFPENHFDVVAGTRFMYMMDRQEKQRIISEIRRVLKPGGTVVLQFNVGFWGIKEELVRLIRGSRRQFRDRYLWPGQVGGLFEGFTVERVIGVKLPRLAAVSRVIGTKAAKSINHIMRLPGFRYLSSYMLAKATKV